VPGAAAGQEEFAMMAMVTLMTAAVRVPDWVAPIAKVVFGGILLIAVLNFFLSSGGGPKDRD
jgi:hypothetical protein